MANSVTTDIARHKMAAARAGDIALPAITKMAFGDGGTDANGDPIAPSGSATALNNQLLQQDVDGHTYPSTTTGRYTCTLAKATLGGEKINEIALVDADGDLVCIKTFTDKNKDADMGMGFEIDDEF